MLSIFGICDAVLTFFIVVSKLSIASFILSSSVRLASWMFVVILELVIGLKLLCPKNDLESKVLTKIWRQLSFERIPFEQFEAWCMNNFLIFFNCIFQFFKFCFNFKLNFGIFNIFLSKGSLRLLLSPSWSSFCRPRRKILKNRGPRTSSSPSQTLSWTSSSGTYSVVQKRRTDIKILNQAYGVGQV